MRYVVPRNFRRRIGFEKFHRRDAEDAEKISVESQVRIMRKAAAIAKFPDRERRKKIIGAGTANPGVLACFSPA